MVSETLRDTIKDLEYEFFVIDAIEKELVSPFEGAIIADLTQFDNSFDKIMNKLKGYSSESKLFLIHSYRSVPKSYEKDNLFWIHSDNVLDELVLALTGSKANSYGVAV